jgi:hypothetical protein
VEKGKMLIDFGEIASLVQQEKHSNSESARCVKKGVRQVSKRKGEGSDE